MNYKNQFNSIFSHFFSKNNTVTVSNSNTYMNNTDANTFIDIYEGNGVSYQQLKTDMLVHYLILEGQLHTNYLISSTRHACVLFELTTSLSNLHKHNYFEFIYIIDGEMEFLIEGVHKRYQTGDICIINQNVRHVEENTVNCHILYLSYTQSYLEKIIRDLSNCSQQTPIANFFSRNQTLNNEIDYIEIFYNQTNLVDSYLMNLIEQIITELLNKQPGYLDMIIGLQKRLFSRIQDTSHYSTRNTRFIVESTSTLFEQTMAYIQMHPYKISRAELAEHLHYNGNYISEVFLKNTGVSMADYIRSNCMHEAASLLLNTNLTIVEIANRIRYENRTVFYKHFKNAYGMLPSEYRNK